MMACSKVNYSIVCALIENSANPNILDKEGKSAIFYALDDKNEGASIVSALLEKGTKPNA